MNSNSFTRASSPVAPVFIWWIIWATILCGLVMIYVFLGRRPPVEGMARGGSLDYLGLAPLAMSVVLRWLVLPRIDRATAALPVFVIGLALGEACGILGIFLSARPAELFALGLLGVLQWAPLFAGRYSAAPAGTQ